MKKIELTSEKPLEMIKKIVALLETTANPLHKEALRELLKEYQT